MWQLDVCYIKEPTQLDATLHTLCLYKLSLAFWYRSLIQICSCFCVLYFYTFQQSNALHCQKEVRNTLLFFLLDFERAKPFFEIHETFSRNLKTEVDPSSTSIFLCEYFCENISPQYFKHTRLLEITSTFNSSINNPVQLSLKKSDIQGAFQFFGII